MSAGDFDTKPVEIDWTVTQPRFSELALLLETYIELNKIIAQPGEKAGRIWDSTNFIEKQIRGLLK